MQAIFFLLFAWYVDSIGDRMDTPSNLERGTRKDK